MSLIERVANKTAVIEVASGTYSDGKAVMQGMTCSAFGMGGARRTQDEQGDIGSEKVFLVCGLSETPALPATITVDAVKYDIVGVKPYRDTRGILHGFRITVAGGY